MKSQISRLMMKKYMSKSMVLPPYNKQADFEWIRYQSHLPWLRLDLPIPHEIIFEEINRLPIDLAVHRDDYSEHRGWKSACLHGRSFLETRENSYYADQKQCSWTPEALKHLPRTVEFFKTQWPAACYRRLRIMLLEPKGYISLHRDSDDSKLDPINIAITQPNDCRFVMENHGCVPFSPGSIFWLDVSNNHVVFNDSDQPRWHIIVHQDLEHPAFQELVVKSYHGLYNNAV